MTDPTNDAYGQWPPPAYPAAASPGGPRPRPTKSFGRFFGETITKAVVYTSAFAVGLAVAGLAFFIGFIGLIGVIVGAEGTTTYDTVAGDEDSDNVILQIPISGIILGESSEGGGGLFSITDATYGYDVKEQLIDAADDDDIGGVVLYMNTPGGTIYGSAAIADGVREFKERAPDKPIHAFVASMSASGGMYAMAPVDEITADQGTLIGSIGVRIGPFVYYNGIIAEDGGLLVGGVETTNGITYTEITAGRGKDVGSPYRPLTDEERAVFQNGVDNSYRTFVSQVAAGRAISPEVITEKIGALIYDEVQARDLGLIDTIANRDAAYEAIAEAAGFPGDDWQVAAEPSGGSLFSLGAIADPPDGSDATGGVRATYQDCFPGAQVLAFYGDPTAHCVSR